jgi:hypothetical protein
MHRLVRANCLHDLHGANSSGRHRRNSGPIREPNCPDPRPVTPRLDAVKIDRSILAGGAVTNLIQEHH